MLLFFLSLCNNQGGKFNLGVNLAKRHERETQTKDFITRTKPQSASLCHKLHPDHWLSIHAILVWRALQLQHTLRTHCLWYLNCGSCSRRGKRAIGASRQLRQITDSFQIKKRKTMSVRHLCEVINQAWNVGVSDVQWGNVPVWLQRCYLWCSIAFCRNKNK